MTIERNDFTHRNDRVLRFQVRDGDGDELQLNVYDGERCAIIRATDQEFCATHGGNQVRVSLTLVELEELARAAEGAAGVLRERLVQEVSKG